MHHPSRHLLVALGLILLTGCQCPCFKKSVPSSMAPVGSSIEKLLLRLKLDGVTVENTKEKKLSSYATPRLRINNDGAIHVYVYVSEVTDAHQEQLRKLGATIELANEDLKLIQAWLPFDKVEEAAAIPFVKAVRSPKYGAPRK